MQTESRTAGETVFEGRILGVRVDTVALPDGGRARREVVEKGPAVVLVPIDGEDNVILVRQFRYPVGEVLLEAPAGVVEGSESPEECAQRELQEEVGYRAGSLESLGRFWTSPGYCTELMHAFVARDLVPSSLEPDADENIEVVRVPVSGVPGLIRRGDVQDAKTIAALLIAICLDEDGGP